MKETKNKVGRPLKYKTNEELKTKIDDYFNYCDNEIRTFTDNKGNEHIIYKPYTVSGLCLFLETNRETLNEYANREGFADTIKGAKTKIENFVEEHSLTGELNPVVSIFNLKNNFNLKDKTEVDVTNKTIVVEKPEFE